jgi:hypothetical protein
MCLWNFTASYSKRNAEQTFAVTQISWTLKIKVAFVFGGSHSLERAGDLSRYFANSKGFLMLDMGPSDWESSLMAQYFL